MNASITASAIALGLLSGIGGFLIIVRRPGMTLNGGVRSLHRNRPTVSPGMVVSSGAIAIGAGVIAFLATGVIGLALAAACLGALVLPWRRRRSAMRVRRRIEQAYPDVIEAIISRVRSGGRLLESLAAAATEAPSAIADPARRFWASVQVSGDSSACLDELKREWASPTGDLLVETVRVAYEVGGTRVVEVLRELADQIRRDRNIRREVDAKQSWVRVAARVGVAAPWVVLVLLAFRSEAALAYNSPAGLALIITGLALSVVAYRVMLVLGRTPTPTRMFQS